MYRSTRKSRNGTTVTTCEIRVDGGGSNAAPRAHFFTGRWHVWRVEHQDVHQALGTIIKRTHKNNDDHETEGDVSHTPRKDSHSRNAHRYTPTETRTYHRVGLHTHNYIHTDTHTTEGLPAAVPRRLRGGHSSLRPQRSQRCWRWRLPALRRMLSD